MEFGLGFPCMNLYPPTLQPWEASATSAGPELAAATAVLRASARSGVGVESSGVGAAALFASEPAIASEPTGLVRPLVSIDSASAVCASPPPDEESGELCDES